LRYGDETLTPLKSVETGLEIQKIPETPAAIKKLHHSAYNEILNDLGEDISGTSVDKSAKLRRAIGLREFPIEGA
jgi:hypothetical protein